MTIPMDSVSEVTPSDHCRALPGGGGRWGTGRWHCGLCPYCVSRYNNMEMRREAAKQLDNVATVGLIHYTHKAKGFTVAHQPALADDQWCKLLSLVILHVHVR